MEKEPLQRIAKVQASLRVRADSPEPILFAHISGRPIKKLDTWTC